MGDDYERFGDGTIEGAFCNDVEYSFENDAPVTVSVDGGSPVEIDSFEIDLSRNNLGTTEMNGTEFPVAEMLYHLSLPVRLDARVGSDITVDGFEATWTFEDVERVSVDDSETCVVSTHIDKSYGVTTDPFE